MTLMLETPGALVPREGIALQPLTDVIGYLETRRPCADFRKEQALYITLPKEVRDDVRTLHAVCRLVAAEPTVSAGIQRAFKLFPRLKHSESRLRAIVDRYLTTSDWVSLVNRAKAGPAWQQQREDNLPEEFLAFCEERFGQFKRSDGKRAAWMSIIRQWRTGRDRDGKAAPIPGYGFWQDWFKARNPEAVLPVEAPTPRGWSYDNILVRLKERARFTKAAAAWLQQGEAAARTYLPQVRGTREGLRFLEIVEFDDVKTDWRVFDPETGEVMDLWLLVARDKATTMLLGFGMRPARVREDGSQEHLRLRDMKQLGGWLLERWGLPPYVCIWKVENGTATFNQSTAQALMELLAGRVEIHWASMIGAKSPTGYKERGIGNSKGKATLESLNRIGHTHGSDLPGQTGPHYSKRPMDLAAREKECKEIWQLARYLPEELRGQEQYPLLTLAQARYHLFRIFTEQNQRTEHEIEGFEELLEWYNPTTGEWLPQNTAPHPLPIGSSVRKRKESPLERAKKLTRGLEWTRVSPDVTTTFYEHTEKKLVVEDSGELGFRHNGNDLWFIHAGTPLAPGQKVLAYFHPDDPKFLHLTDGKGSFLGTWYRRGRVGAMDQDALSEAIAFTTAARNAVKAVAEEIVRPEREQLEAMRQHNTALFQQDGFVDVADAPQTMTGNIGSPVSAGLVAVTKQRVVNTEIKEQRKVSTTAAHNAGRAALMGDD